MEEQILVESQRCSLKNFNAAMLILGVVISVVCSYFTDMKNSIAVPIYLGILVIINLFYYLFPCSICVKENTVTGDNGFFTTVSLPVDSITAVAKSRFFSRIIVSTASGHISFPGIKNAAQIYDVIYRLLLKRQAK